MTGLHCRGTESSVSGVPCVIQVTMNSVIHFLSISCSIPPPPQVCLSRTQQLSRALAAILSAYNAIYSKNTLGLVLLLYIFGLYVSLSMTVRLTSYPSLSLFFFKMLGFFFLSLYFALFTALNSVNAIAVKAGYMLAVLANIKFSNTWLVGKVTFNT